MFDTIASALNSREVRRPLAELSSRLGLVRKFIRCFRFLDALSDSFGTFSSLAGPAVTKGSDGTSTTLYLQKTLDGLASTFNGLYLLLEATTLVDALGIQGLVVLGAELESATKIEAQRCWFVSLVFGALACVLQLSTAQKTAPTKAPTKPVSEKNDNGNTHAGKDEKSKTVEAKSHVAKTTSQQRRLSRKLVVCLLDLPLPGSIVGWIPASPGTVGLLMLTTSVLTGYDVWERCGREVGRV